MKIRTFLFTFLIFLFLHNLFASQKSNYFSNGTVHLIISSHQDIGWEDTPDACIAYRDSAIITPALEMIKRHPNYCYSVESVLSLLEYLERHPEKKPEILAATKSGRLEWGATYTQPYESLYDGEALVRQVYYGRKLLRKILPGCDSKAAWNPDVPARAKQMPQILAKSGIKYLLISRHGEGFFTWSSPDGSSVLTYSAGHYYEDSRRIFEQDEHNNLVMKDIDKIVDLYSTRFNQWQDYYIQHNLPPHASFILSRDLLKPTNMDNFIISWNFKVSTYNTPRLTYSTLENFMNNIAANSPHPPEIIGERPNIWLYIHGPTHHKAISASRRAARLLPAAEMFSTINALLSGSINSYPAEQFEKAWMDAIYPDHGWGGVNGHITDRVFRTKFETAQRTAETLLHSALNSISEKIAFKISGIPIVVYNQLSSTRSEPVTWSIDVEGYAYPHLNTNLDFDLLDCYQNKIPFQIISDFGQPGTLDEQIKIIFIAENVPPIGYKTYYLVPGTKDQNSHNLPLFENDYYKIELCAKGLKSIYDKQLEKELLNTDKFLGAELFSMTSVGEGAGEFAQIQLPAMENFEKSSQYPLLWNCIDNGPVCTVWETSQKMEHCTFRQQISLYHTVKRIDFNVALLGWDGTESREFRLAFPLNMEKAHIAYDVPMGVLQVGKDEIAGAAGQSCSYLTYSQPNSDVHPREVQDWFHASDDDFGVTMSSSVAVFDWIDPTEKPVSYPVLQPLLLASRRSCNQKGNWYLQPGDHFYHFSLTSHSGNWTNNHQNRNSVEQPLIAVSPNRKVCYGELPEEQSFIKCDKNNIIISTVKKCEDDDHVILRCYDNEGKNSTATFEFFLPLAKAERTNLIEEEGVDIPINNNKLEINVGHHSIETVKLFVKE